MARPNDELADLRRAVISLIREAEVRAGESYSPHIARAKAILAETSDSEVTPVYWRRTPPAPTVLQWGRKIDWGNVAALAFRWTSGFLALIGAVRALWRAYCELQP